MYKDHYLFEPADQKAKVWHYMDFAKFVSVLEKSQLFFPTLRNLEDKFEGSITQADIDRRESFSNYLKTILSDYDDEQKRAKELKFRKRLRSLVCVNCWHQNEDESAAMWKLYLKNNQGVAIRSTFKLLTESFNDYHENDVYVGRVFYSAQTSNPEDHFIRPLLHKLPSFECEHEIRALISAIPVDHFAPEALNLKRINRGLFVTVNIKNLIETIYVSPTSENWFLKLVKSVVEKYVSKDLSERVTRSNLSKNPLF
jgi:hypothetical protein